MEDAEHVAMLKKKISDCFFQIPIQVLSNETKDKLKFLDCSFLLPGSVGNVVNFRDYRGLAILLGYSTMDLNYLIDQKKYKSPTFLLLEKMKETKKSVGDLILCLLQLKRSDIISNIMKLCKNDIVNYLSKSNTKKVEKVDYEDLKEMTSSAEVDEANKTLGRLFTTDIIETSNRRIEIYDIFISFESESIPDIKAMWTLSKLLEEEGLTVAKGSYSFFQGCCLVEAFANAIYNRSKKVILLLSQAYIKSESCCMQLNFAKHSDSAAWKNKVIPVYIENVKKPESIANLNCFKYYNDSIRQMFLASFINNMRISCMSDYANEVKSDVSSL